MRHQLPAIVLFSSDNAGFSREGAHLFLLILTDEGDSSTEDASTYLDFFHSIYNDVLVAGVFPGARRNEDGHIEYTCNNFNATPLEIDRYFLAVEETGGTYISACDFTSDDVARFVDSIYVLAQR